VGEVAVAVVAVKLGGAEVVDDEEIGFAAVVGVAPGAGKAVAIVFDVHAGGGGGFDEGEIAFVVKETVGRAVAGVVVGDGVVILIEPQVVLVGAEVEVEAAVAVVVGCGGVGEGALGLLRETKSIALEGEGAVAAIFVEQGTGAAEDEEILEAAVAEVGEEGGGGVIEDADAGLFGHIFESAVATISVEAVGQAGGLADVEIVEAVVVVIACCDAVVAVDIDTDGAVEDCAPVVGAVEKLLRVGLIRADGLGGDVDEGGAAEGGGSFIAGLPAAGFPGWRCVLGCSGGGVFGAVHVPGADAFFGEGVFVLEDEVVAEGDADGERVLRGLVDSVDLEFGGADAGCGAEPGVEAFEESIAVEGWVGIEGSAFGIDAEGGADFISCLGRERDGLEGWAEEFGDVAQVLRGCDEVLAPALEDGFDFDGVFFGDVFVGAGCNAAEDVGQGRLVGVVRGEADVGEFGRCGVVGRGLARCRKRGGTEEGRGSEEDGGPAEGFE